jgi:capsular polysaccharide biosynthesis protein
MEETQSPSNSGTPTGEDEISLLDIMLTLAENVKLLIIGPLLVGLCALGLGYVLPRTFESVAVLQADQGTASLMTTAAVLDPVIAKLGLGKDASPEQARRELERAVKATIGKADKLLTLTVSASTPQQAQTIANALLEQTYAQISPKGTVRSRLEVQLAEAQERGKNSQDAAALVIQRMESLSSNPASGGNLSQIIGYAELLGASAAAQTQVSALEAQLEGLSASQLVQPPSLPEKASQPKKGLLAIGSTLATGFLLLLFIFVRQALRTAAVDPEAADKLARIRRALGLR